MRICLIASNRFPIREPFAGGLEALTHVLARELGRRGHQVTVFAAPGSDPRLRVTELPVAGYRASVAARADVGALPDAWLADHHAYLGLMLELARSGAERFDVVHNNSLHYLPVAMAETLSVPVVTTLHTPPVPWLESAVLLASRTLDFTAVSRSAAASWSHLVRCTPILNGVDTDVWRPGAGGGPAVWSGRMVPEKAPHEAIDAARRAGVPLRLAGPVVDAEYFDSRVAPRLGGDMQYVGHLRHRELATLLGGASVALVTPAWDEPYGLVCSEALACGTPVAAYDRGAMGEILTPETGELARPGDVDDLARALHVARTRDRAAARAHAVQHHSLTAMVDAYERFFALRSLGSAA
ncbi:MAG: glycosyl transferase family 1 [Nocardioides sp.]|nr:glycosyl transferase family 1 [Nocardioides sp.]